MRRRARVQAHDAIRESSIIPGPNHTESARSATDTRNTLRVLVPASA